MARSRTALRTALVGASTTVLLLSLAACGGDTASSAEGSSEAGTCLDDIQARGELRVGTVSNLPIDAVDAQGDVIGINGDLLRDFIAETGIAESLATEPMPFSSLIPSIQTGKIDITSDTMFKTPEREAQIGFTGEVFYNPEGFLVRAGNPEDLHQLADLGEGTSVATYQGTVWVDWVQELAAEQGVTPQIFPGANELHQAIAAGQVDAGLMSSAISSYMINENPDLGTELVEDYEPRSRQGVVTHLGVPQECTDLQEEFDTFYEGYVGDGRMEALLTEWGVTPVEAYLDGIAGYTAS